VKFGRLVFDSFRKNENGLLHLLSHAHRDHTSGLTNNWMHAPILCTETTAKVIMAQFPGIPKALFVLKKSGDTVEIDDVDIQITDANHCPGSVMFSCSSHRDQRKIVFTGDFRLNAKIRENIELLKNADVMYLDCTFNEPMFQFPSQKQAIVNVIELIEKNPDREIHLSVYSIGKNKIVQAVSEYFNTPVYTPPSLYKVYNAIGMGRFITTNQNTWIHSYPGQYLGRRYSKSDEIVRISPTGWACRFRSKPEKNLYYVPYSEHNDYNRLHEFVQLAKPKKIVPICGKWTSTLPSSHVTNREKNSHQSTLF